MFREADGKLSFSRMTGLIIVLANLGGMLIAALNGAATEATMALADIPGNWAMLVGGIYGLNKVGGALVSRSDSGNGA